MSETNSFSLRKKLLDEEGNIVYVSHHFGIKLREVESKVRSVEKAVIDIDNMKLRFKRMHAETGGPLSEARPLDEEEDEESQEQTEGRLLELMPSVLNALRETGREGDLIAVVESIVSGRLSVHNIALNLLLDLGQYLNQQSSEQMSYSQTYPLTSGSL